VGEVRFLRPLPGKHKKTTEGQMTTKKFTLLELLIVVAIIGVLAGLLLPTVNYVQRKAKDSAAKSKINNLSTAIHAFYSQNNVLPISGTVERLTNAQYDVMIETLTGIDGPDADSVVSSTFRPCKLLDVSAEYATKGYLDPFGNRMAVVMDLNYDKTCTVDGEDILSMVAIYSFGRNGEDENGAGDDICSWK
jgi:prepilin-type N-terminal cleavage/methylation domain-containing protein